MWMTSSTPPLSRYVISSIKAIDIHIKAATLMLDAVQRNPHVSLQRLQVQDLLEVLGTTEIAELDLKVRACCQQL